MLDNTKMSHFCTVYESGSLHEAGRVLGLTPGSLSRSLKQTQSELGFVLFQLQGRSLVPTPKGKEAYATFRKILDHTQNELRRLQKPAAQTLNAELVRLATFELFSTHVMSNIISTELPQERILLYERIPGQIEESLLKNEVDIGITNAPQPEPGLLYDRIGTSDIHVYGQLKKWQTTPAEKIPFAVPISPIGRNLAQIHFLDGWNIKHSRLTPYRFEMFETALQLAKRGHCAVTLPRFIGTLPQYHLDPLPQFKKGYSLNVQQIFLVRRREDPEDSAYKKLAKGLRRILAT